MLTLLMIIAKLAYIPFKSCFGWCHETLCLHQHTMQPFYDNSQDNFTFILSSIALTPPLP
jgi:hypothetical protein